LKSRHNVILTKENVEMLRSKGHELSTILDRLLAAFVSGEIALDVKDQRLAGKDAYAVAKLGKIEANQAHMEKMIKILIEEIKNIKRKLGMEPMITMT